LNHNIPTLEGQNQQTQGSTHNGYAMWMTSIKMIKIQHIKLEDVKGDDLGRFSQIWL